jgi:tripartite-type tricarboxylate transporter receptor subunit TctC
MILLHHIGLSRCAVAAASLLLATGGLAQAQQYPDKKITFVVGFAAGGFADTLARFVGQKLNDRLGQTVLVENRGGAGGNTAARAVATAAPDGYTVLVTTTALAINNTMYKSLDYSLDQLTPIAMPASSAETFAAPTGRASNLKDLIAQAKGREITFATAGVGSGSHLATEYFFKELAKIKAAHVPFRGGSLAIQAALGNQVDVVTSSFGSTSHIAAGKLNGLAVASAKRNQLIPNVPTFAEAGFAGFEAASWVGFFVPAKTPPAIVARLNKEINDIIADKANDAHLSKLGYQLAIRSAPDSAAYLKAEVEKWGKMVKSVNIYVN